MKVRMLVGVSGGRGDGSPWPALGGTLDVDDAEGRHLVQAGWRLWEQAYASLG